MLRKSKQFNENYASQIIEIKQIIPHSNADKLEMIVHQGNNIIIAKNSLKIGDIVIFCAVGSQLNPEFLKANNQFEDKSLNSDNTIKGFFNKQGRVRAISLRGEVSKGFIFPISWLKIWQPNIEIEDILKNINSEFDTVNNIWFSKKYFIQDVKQKGSNPTSNKRNKDLPKFDKLVENQFNFHYDTALFAKHLDLINPNSLISITSKFHGTSAIFANILINRELNWFEKCLKRFGIKVKDKEYDLIISSRGVIKNRYINNYGLSYYQEDVWTHAGNSIRHLIPKGHTIYAEIVGYLPGTNTFIQKNHDYKCQEGKYEIYIYRVTITNEDGNVHELSAKDVQIWCHQRGLNPVKELYYGYAKDLYPNIYYKKKSKEQLDRFSELLLQEIKNDKDRFYMECNSPDCWNHVPHEGIVIRNDSDTNIKALKVKTDAHYLMETKQQDEDIEIIE